MNNYTGLNDENVIINREKYGSNEIIENKKNSFISLFLESLGDPIIKILLIALMIKIVFLFKDFDWFETLGIVIAIFLSSLISTISEYGSEKAFEKMKEESLKLKAKVIRNKIKKEIYISEIVKDDIVILQQGDKVPADGIIVEGEVSVDESSINGETKEIIKAYNLKDTEKRTLYRGTVIYNGYCIMKVTKVGKDTFYGKIAFELQEKADESPLKLRLRKLAKTISYFGYIGAFLASFSYLFSKIVVDNNFVLSNIINTITNVKLMSDYIIYALTLTVTIIIVSVPEGLPMMITLVLSSNMKRMVKDNVLVRKLVGIETAGNINILFSDKTGTLTTGKLKVEEIIDGSLNQYKTEADLKLKDKNYELIKCSMIVNNSCSYDNNTIIGGNTTDKSLLEFYENPKSNLKKIKVKPFNSKNKYMITVIDNEYKNLIKGAPEVLIDECKYYYNNGIKSLFTNKNKIKRLVEENTKNGKRVILLAISDNNIEDLFKNLIFVGIVIMNDVIRKEALKSIEEVNDAGIQTVMITGDNKDTAIYISRKVGILKDDNDIVLTSNELNQITDSELKRIMPNLRVIARSLPQDKSRLVRVAKEMDLVVGMTGDGVNDAPALKKADVGFAFGSGSEVSKEASDIIILDNNFKSIVNAILYGRTIFKSIRKFIIFQLTVNFCALSISIIGPFIGVNSPITVIQMLWINMVMDTLAGLAFAFEPPLIEYLKEKALNKKEDIMNSYMYNEIFISGLYTTIVCILFLKSNYIRTLFLTQESFMTAFFALFIFLSIFNALNAHTTRINIIENLYKNKMFLLVLFFVILVQIILIYFGGSLFRTVPLSIKELFIIIIISLSIIPFDMVRKKFCVKRKL